MPNRSLKLDFAHVGYHKTASTWFQVYGLKAHPGIVMVNESGSPYDESFIESFVNPGELDFSKEQFQNTYVDKFLHERGGEKGKIYGICEENLTGHYWHGSNEKLLADRLRATFGPTKIIIMIRNQIAMLRSLYSNYVKNGGTKSLSDLLVDTEFWGWKVYAKLCYHRLVEYYAELFSPKNVLVLCYEDFRDNPRDLMARYLSFIGASPLAFSAELIGKKINPGLSLPSEHMTLWANRLSGSKELPKRVIRFGDRLLLAKAFSSTEREIEPILDHGAVGRWRESNRRLEKHFSLDLSRLRYPL